MRGRAWMMAAGLVGVATLGALGPARGAEFAPDAPAPEPASQDDAIDALMARLRAVPGLSARFTETKTIGLLAVPLINEGTLHYQPPGHLLRTIETPHRSQVLLVADAIWVREGGKSEQIDLAAHPTARAFVGSFRSLLAGDREALARHFELELHRDDEHESWTLHLRPRTEAMTRIVTRMKISGHREIVDRIVIEEATGDISDTRFADVDPKRRYSAQEAARLFAPPG